MDTPPNPPELAAEQPRRPCLGWCLLSLLLGIGGSLGAFFLLSASSSASSTKEGATVIAHPSQVVLASVSFSTKDEVRALDGEGRPWVVVDDKLQAELSATFYGPYYAFVRVAESGLEVGMLRTAGGVNFIRRGVGSSDALGVAGDRLALDGDWAALASVASDTVSLCLKAEESWAMTGVTATVTPARGGGCESLALGSGLLAVGNGQGQVTVFDVETQELLVELSAPAEVTEGTRVVALAFSEDGTEIAAALESHLVVWSLEKEEVTLHAPIDGSPLTAVACGKGLYLVGDSAGAVTVYGAGNSGEHELYFPYAAEPPLRPLSAVKSIAITGWRFAWCVNDQLFVFDVATLPIRIKKGSKTYTMPR